MTEMRQRGVGRLAVSPGAYRSQIRGMTAASLQHRINETQRQLDIARADFRFEWAWHPGNHYRLCDWYETLACWYDMRAQASVLAQAKASA